ncbi:MAG: Lrp/AsnC family transcriptional regulator [Candidatus Diapherotrites archaeon]|nr:Lrp/AsnC family transcriptional regulator [Candidatus Diapherotrites archaeon]
MLDRLSRKEQEVLLGLVKNGRVSDRELAKRLNSSQPTITRVRSKLFQLGYLTKTLGVPDLTKVGLALEVFTFLRHSDINLSKRVIKWVQDHDAVYFAAEGEGLRGYTMMINSIHQNFSEYEAFLTEFRSKFGTEVHEIMSFFIDTQRIHVYHNWSSVMEGVMKREWSKKKMRKRERLKHALEMIPKIPANLPFIPKRAEDEESPDSEVDSASNEREKKPGS